MKKVWYFVFLMMCALVVTSCSDDDDDVDEVWREENRVAFLNTSGNKEYEAIASTSNAGSIYIKRLNNGEGTTRPLYNSTVKVFYKGTLIDGKVFDSGADPEFDSPVQFEVNKVVDGFSTALQNMVVGDRWEVWIPYDMGYGTAASGSIPGYSTLVFMVELAEIVGQSDK